MRSKTSSSFLVAAATLLVATAPPTEPALGFSYWADFGSPRLPFDLGGFDDPPAARHATSGLKLPYARLQTDDGLTLAVAHVDRRELRCMTAAVYYEARSEGTAGQRAVAQVVLNRLQHYHFPATVCGVVYEGSDRPTGCQFSFTCDGSEHGELDRLAWARAERIAQEALGGYVYAPIGRATHYHTTAIAPYWKRSMHPLATVGSHAFYRWRGNAGSADAYVGEKRPGMLASLS